MCFHKSLVQRESKLIDHYQASFQSIHAELAAIKEQLLLGMAKDGPLHSLILAEPQACYDLLTRYGREGELPAHFTTADVATMKSQLNLIMAFSGGGVARYHENGFNYLPTPVITAGEPHEFRFFRWGLIPFFMKDRAKAMQLRAQTLNCISEEMFKKPSFRDALKNGQRCLIPVTGFFEWRWLDEQGTVKIPYLVTFRDQEVRSLAGLYSTWKDPDTSEYYYRYTVLTTRANSILQYVHNHKQRMPVVLAREEEKAWLNRDLSERDVLELCHPSLDPAMRAYTISKLLTTRHVNTNVPEVLQPLNYNTAIAEAHRFLEAGEKKRALEAFQAAVAGESLKLDDLAHVARLEIKSELSLA